MRDVEKSILVDCNERRDTTDTHNSTVRGLGWITIWESSHVNG